MLIKARQSVNLSLAGCAKPSRSPSTQAQDERKQFHVIELFHSVPAEALEAFLVFSSAARMNSFKTILIPGSVLNRFRNAFPVFIRLHLKTDLICNPSERLEATI